MMYKYKFLLIIALGISSIVRSQDVILNMETESDSINKTETLKFSSFNEAELVLNQKVDSLQKKGYPFLNENRKIENNQIDVSIELNQKIDSILISLKEEHLELIPKQLLTSGHNKVSISYSEIDNFFSYIIQELKNKGYPFGNARLANIEIANRNTIKADVKIETAEQRTINKINIRGYSSLSEKYLARYSNLRTGNVFIEEEIQDKTDQLNNIPFLKVKKPTDVLFKKDSTELFVYLEKVNSNSFDGFLGFGNSEENNFQLNGYINMVLLNNLNFGERLGIIYKNDGFGQQTFNGDISLPFIFKTPLSLEAGLRIFRRDSSFSNSSQALNLSYQLNEKLNLQGGVEFTNSTSLESKETISSTKVVDFSSTFYELGLNFLQLSSRQGFDENTFFNINLGLGKREGLNTEEQYKLSLTGQHQIDLNDRSKIYLKFNSQVLISETYFNNELFRFGGFNSIRGFVENSLIANRYAVLQTEYRYLLDANLFINTVLDLGNYENKLTGINENILGYGVGLGLKSKAGIFRLVLANAISKTQQTSFSNSKIHISFTSFF